MENVKYKFNSAIMGELTYLKNGNLRVKNNVIDKEFTAERMREIAKEYKGSNRIHKPIALQFWIDCKNGKYSNCKTN